jgi:uncharacterized Fe-S radical SAM superfamily protein PflX
LARRIDELKELLEPCRLCPRECGASRISGKRGECGIIKHKRDKRAVPLSRFLVPKVGVEPTCGVNHGGF